MPLPSRNLNGSFDFPSNPNSPYNQAWWNQPQQDPYRSWAYPGGSYGPAGDNPSAGTGIAGGGYLQQLEEEQRRRLMNRFSGWGPNRQRMFMQGQTPNSPFMQQGNPINPFQQVAPVLQRPGAVNESGRFGASPGMGQMPTPQPSNPYSPTGRPFNSNPISPLSGGTNMRPRGQEWI